MKKLKESTIKQYSVQQLIKHLERYQDSKNLNCFRVDQSYNTLYAYDENFNVFMPVSTLNHHDITVALDYLYKQ